MVQSPCFCSQSLGENDIPEIIELMKSSKTPNRKTPKRVLRDLTNQPESELPSQTKKRNRDSSEIGYQSPQPTKIRPLYDTPQPFGDYNGLAVRTIVILSLI